MTTRNLGGPLAAAALLSLATLTTGCILTSSADRLAYCVEDAARELYRSPDRDEVRRACDLRVSGESWVIAFPWSAVSSARLEEAGLTRDEIARVNELQGEAGVHARINVIPKGAPEAAPNVWSPGRASTSAYHDPVVDTPELLLCHSDGGPVEVVLRRRGERPLWVGLEASGPDPD